jgi:hypothetical protein
MLLPSLSPLLLLLLLLILLLRIARDNQTEVVCSFNFIVVSVNFETEISFKQVTKITPRPNSASHLWLLLYELD